MSEQGTLGTWKCLTSVIIQKVEIITRLETSENGREVMAFIQHWVIDYLCYEERMDGLQPLVASNESVKDIIKQ